MVTRKYQVTIPKEVREELKIKVGDNVVLHACMTPIAGQPRLKAYSLKTSQVHLALKGSTAKMVKKVCAVHPPLKKGGLLASVYKI